MQPARLAFGVGTADVKIASAKRTIKSRNRLKTACIEMGFREAPRAYKEMVFLRPFAERFLIPKNYDRSFRLGAVH